MLKIGDVIAWQQGNRKIVKIHDGEETRVYYGESLAVLIGFSRRKAFFVIDGRVESTYINCSYVGKKLGEFKKDFDFNDDFILEKRKC